MASAPSNRHGGGSKRVCYVLLFVITLFARPVWPQSTPQDPDYTCSADKPCAVGCCDKFGICGMGPDFCSPENCVNSCDAKSECDPAGWGPQYALSEGCPLNVCCSKFGFCGTTAEFCGDEVVPNPSCSGTSAQKRTIGYYEGWAVTRSCDAMTPESIHWGAYTHINFAFASIDPNSFVVVPADPGDLDLYSRLTGLKSLVPGLQVWISIGGWSMNDPDQPTATTFSDLAGSAEAQASFSDSLIQLMSTYGFDGVDIDWEYPVAPERSGRPEDFANYPTWLSNLRAAFQAAGHNWGLSITLPSSFWYLQNFDVVRLEPIVDWFNMMEYDLHGTWDSTDVWIGAFVSAHTNLTEIDESLKLLWRNNIDPSKVVLGLGFYGRSFALQDPSCTATGCPFTGGAPAGPCTDSVGTLSFAEIETIIADGATVTLDEAAAVKIVTWDGNWVSYDDASTLQTKVDYANSICLGGTMVWAVSLDDKSGTASNALAGSGSVPKSEALLPAQNPLSVCAWSGCVAPGSPPCPAGQSSVFSTTDGCGVTNDQIAQAGTTSAFPNRYYCCPSNQMATCALESPDPESHSCVTPACAPGTVNVGTFQRFTAQPECPNVNVNLCCDAPNTISPRSLGCFWTQCGTSTCPSDTAALVSATIGQDGSASCLGGQQQTLCCPSPPAIDKSTCSWQQGSSLRGICVPGCPRGQIEVARDIFQGQCILRFSSYCCDPPTEDTAANQEGVGDFESVVHQFMSGSTCSVAPNTLGKRQSSGTLSTVTTIYMASRLAPILWSYDFDTSELQYIKPYQQAWDQERAQTGSGLPSWDSLANTVSNVGSSTDLVGVIASQLCTTITQATFDPIVCSLETCSGGGTCPLQQRAMADTPADVTPQNFDTTAVRAGPDFTQANTFEVGATAWWMQAKNLDWWLGSNHGVDNETGAEQASSVYVPFTPNPSANVITGAGPVWGCTIVSVVSNFGAWTAHFWQGFFDDDARFDSEVLDFLVEGNLAEAYPGLAILVVPGGSFDLALVDFLSVIIMTPLAYELTLGAHVWEKPQIVPGVGPLYPLRVAQIETTLGEIFGIRNLAVAVHTYAPDQLIWNWVGRFTADAILHWTWEVDRSPRLNNAPWTGMLTIQRRPTDSPGLDPAVRIYVEDDLVFSQLW